MDTLKIFMNRANYRSMRREYLAIEQFAPDFKGMPGESFFMPGEEVEVVRIKGMKGDKTYPSPGI